MMRALGIFGEAFQASSNFQILSIICLRSEKCEPHQVLPHRIVFAVRLFRGHLASSFSISLFYFFFIFFGN